MFSKIFAIKVSLISEIQKSIKVAWGSGYNIIKINKIEWAFTQQWFLQFLHIAYELLVCNTIHTMILAICDTRCVDDVE